MYPFGNIAYCDHGDMGLWDFRDACLMLQLQRLPAMPAVAKLVARRIGLA